MPPGLARTVATRDPAARWSARFGWVVGLVVFGVCVVIGFGVGFLAGRSEPTKRADKPVPEVAKLTVKGTPPTTPKPASTSPTEARPAATVPTKPEPPKTPPTAAKQPTTPPTKPEAKKPEPKPAAKGDAPTFAKVSVVFKDKCVVCHGGVGNPKGGLDLRTLAAVNKGGDSGPAVSPGDLAKSQLWDSIDSGQMPPPKKEPLTADEKKLIRDWILGGAK